MLDCHLNPETRSLPIPDTAPGGTVQLSVTLRAPPLPCTAISVWKVADADGELCFPETAGLWARVRVVAI